MSFFLQLVVDGLAQGMLLACVAAGFGVVYRSLRVFHVAVGAQFVFSGYAFYAATALLRLSPVWAIALTLLLSLAFAQVLEFAVYRPFARKGCAGGVTMIASLGMLIVTENVIALCFGNEMRTIPHPPVPVVEFGCVHLTVLQIAQFLCSLAAFAAAGAFVRCSRLMKAAWAQGDDPGLVRTMCLPAGRIRATVVAVGAALVAVPSVLLAADTGVDPHDGLRWMLMASVAVFFGGRELFWAWGFGALFIGVMQSVAVWKLPAEWAEAFAFALLLLVLLVFPRGLFGGVKRLRGES